MKTGVKINNDEPEEMELLEFPETILCIDTICNICYAEFLDEEDLKLHVIQVHLTAQSRSRYCQYCSSIFASTEDYAIHLRDIHLLMIRCCRYCTRAFNYPPDVRKHEKKHNVSLNKSTYSCSQCNLIFHSIMDLEQHEITEHKDANDGVFLQDCFSILSSVLNINVISFLQSLGDNVYVYTCTKCKLKTPDVEFYLKHLYQSNCRSFACDKCYNVYKDKYSVGTHMSRHPECSHVVDINLHKQCKNCNQMFSISVLKQHKKECRAMKCNTCEFVCQTVQELTEHQATHQTKFSIKVCKYCHREFVGDVALNKHVERSHKNEIHLYKYFCKYCNNIFKHPKNLFAHFFSRHRDLKPYTCKICNNTFRLRKQFTLHIKLTHKSIGSVRFDENFHVIFSDEDCVELEGNEQVTNAVESKRTLEEKDSSDIREKHESKSPSAGSLLIPFKHKDVVINNDGVELVICPTETETDQTDGDVLKMTPKQELKRKRRGKKTKEYLELTTHEHEIESEGISDVKCKRRVKNKEYLDLTNQEIKDLEDISDDEPLIQVKRRVKKNPIEKIRFLNYDRKSKEIERNKSKFTCKLCKKYCYTFQNYNHHMSLHQAHEIKKCIKCSKVFKSKSKLKHHIATSHSSSKLTETLKSMLARRKTELNVCHGIPKLNDKVSVDSVTERFRKTIKKVNVSRNDSTATLTPVTRKLSVQKFIENFTPESNDSCIKKDVNVNSCDKITIQTLNSPIHKAPVIKMTKFEPSPQPTFTKLQMPIEFKDTGREHYKVSIKLVQKPLLKSKMNFISIENKNEIPETDPSDNHCEDMNIEIDHHDATDENDNSESIIPDVAQEIMLEETVEVPKPKKVTHKIVIPNLPKQYKDVHIAHLLPEAPFYKIVKIENKTEEDKQAENQNDDESIALPEGTKLVSVNPLAHLIGDKPIEIPRNKYYKPKQVDYEKAVAKALFDSQSRGYYKKSKNKELFEKEQ